MSWNPFKRTIARSATIVCKFCGSDEYYIDDYHYYCGNCKSYCNMYSIGRYGNIPFIQKRSYWMIIANQLNLLGDKDK